MPCLSGRPAVGVPPPPPDRSPLVPGRVRPVRGGARVVTPDSLPTPSMGAPVPEPYTVVFECSGNAAAGESAMEQLDFAGVCVLVGTGHDFPRLNHNRVIVLENTIIGSYNYDAG